MENPPLIFNENFLSSKVLTISTSCYLYSGIDLSTGDHILMKTKLKPAKSSPCCSFLQNEYSLLKSLPLHPNIVNPKHFDGEKVRKTRSEPMSNSSPECLIFEDQGSLTIQDFLVRFQIMNEKQTCFFAKEILSALNHLREHKMFVGSVDPSSIMITKKFRPLLIGKILRLSSFEQLDNENVICSHEKLKEEDDATYFQKIKFDFLNLLDLLLGSSLNNNNQSLSYEYFQLKQIINQKWPSFKEITEAPWFKANLSDQEISDDFSLNLISSHIRLKDLQEYFYYPSNSTNSSNNFNEFINNNNNNNKNNNSDTYNRNKYQFLKKNSKSFSLQNINFKNFYQIRKFNSFGEIK